MGRKVHNKERGYIAEKMNHLVKGSKVVIHIAAKQGLDVGDNKYSISCDAHSTLVGTTSTPNARILMKQPEQFCDGCRDLIHKPDKPFNLKGVAEFVTEYVNERMIDGLPQRTHKLILEAFEAWETKQ